jgi:ectoine hydroxylase-related dioxygenase (phytanoyl-CoA dioxygenase family)
MYSILSQKQIESFFNEGFLIIPDCFNKAEIEVLANKANILKIEAEELAQHSCGKVMNRGTQFIVDKIEDIVQISRIVWAGAAEPELLSISRQDKLLCPISQILGSKEADQLINQLHYKLPHDGVNFFWHQDVHNRRNFDPEWQDINGKGSFVQSIIAIDPMTIENGAIFMIPQSMKYGEIPYENFQNRLATILTSDKIIPLLLNPGDVVLMHPYLIHGSFPNESEESRTILINGFAYPGANTKAYPGVGSAERINLVVA